MHNYKLFFIYSVLKFKWIIIFIIQTNFLFLFIITIIDRLFFHFVIIILDSSKIGNEGAKSLADMLKINRNLTDLNLCIFIYSINNINNYYYSTRIVKFDFL